MQRKPNPAQLAKYREVLNQLRYALSGDIEHLQADAFSDESARFTTDNPADTGSDSFSQTFSLELLRRDTAILTEIDDALGRLDDGTFGQCEECAAWIQKARMDAVPFARLCIGCQQRVEGKR